MLRQRRHLPLRQRSAWTRPAIPLEALHCSDTEPCGEIGVLREPFLQPSEPCIDVQVDFWCVPVKCTIKSSMLSARQYKKICDPPRGAARVEQPPSEATSVKRSPSDTREAAWVEYAATDPMSAPVARVSAAMISCTACTSVVLKDAPSVTGSGKFVACGAADSSTWMKVGGGVGIGWWSLMLGHTKDRSVSVCRGEVPSMCFCVIDE